MSSVPDHLRPATTRSPRPGVAPAPSRPRGTGAGPGTSAAHRGVPGTHAPVPPASYVVPLAGGTGSVPGASASQATVAGAPGSRSWRIEMPAGMELLNSNDRDGHWGRRKRITDALRQTAGWLARQQRIPRLERAHVLAILQPPDKRKRDPGNWYPSYKACIDGMVSDAGILPGDDAQYLDGPDPRLGETFPRGRIVFIVTEIAQ